MAERFRSERIAPVPGLLQATLRHNARRPCLLDQLRSRLVSGTWQISLMCSLCIVSSDQPEAARR